MTGKRCFLFWSHNAFESCFYSARHFVSIISLYSGFYIVFLQITFIIAIVISFSVVFVFDSIVIVNRFFLIFVFTVMFVMRI